MENTMSNTIDTGKIYIKDVFTKWYRIPEYQRPYVWGKDQIHDLLDDISFSQNQNKDSEYFLGSIVFQRKDIKTESGTFIENDLLDGQQRLTTLLLLTSVIRDLSPNQKRKTTCQDSIFQEANSDDNIPERLRIVFDIRDEVRDFVEDFVKPLGGTQKIDELIELRNNSNISSIKNMANAILVITSYFQDNNNINIDDFFPYFRNKVLMIYVASDSLEDAFRLFTIMNDRGIKLRNSDILKAENLRFVEVTEKRTNFAKEWEDIESYFQEDFDVFLSHLRTILVKEKARLSLLDEFEKNIYNPQKFNKETKKYYSTPPKLTKGSNTFSFLKRYKTNYIDIFDTDNYERFSSYKFDGLLNVMSATLPADMWMPPVLSFYDKFKYDNIFGFLQKLDNKFSCDWILQLTPTQRIENMNNILKSIENSESSEQLLCSDIFDINIDKLMSELSGEIYGRRYAKYILYKLDYILSSNDDKLNTPKTISVEHILPQNPKDDSIWKVDFSSEQRDSLTNKIGNLALISRRKNSSQGRLNYKAKREKYFTKNIELFRNSVRVFSLNTETWTPSAIEKNQETVINLIKKHYEK